jgi:hypothetical protein
MSTINHKNAFFVHTPPFFVCRINSFDKKIAINSHSSMRKQIDKTTTDIFIDENKRHFMWALPSSALPLMKHHLVHEKRKQKQLKPLKTAPHTTTAATQSRIKT